MEEIDNALLGISAELWHREHAPSREVFLALGLPIWDGILGKDGRRGQQGRHGHDPNVITVPEAARELGISNDLAYSLARRGELPGAFQFGRRWLVSRVRLRRFLHGSEDLGTQEPG